MSDLYQCDYRALAAPPCEPCATFEVDLEDGPSDGKFPSPQELIEIMRVEHEDTLNSGLVKLVLKVKAETLTLYFTNGVLHRNDGGPCRIVEEPKSITFMFFQDGILHREGGAAVIKFTKTDVNGWMAPEFEAAAAPDMIWGGIHLQFFDQGGAGKKVYYIGVNQWYPDEQTMFMSAHRVAFRASERKDFAYSKGNVFLKKIELPYLKEVWEDGQLTARSFDRPELKWQRQREGSFMIDDVSDKVNAWIAKHMEGQIDPYHPELFTDVVDEWAFLQEFGSA